MNARLFQRLSCVAILAALTVPACSDPEGPEDPLPPDDSAVLAGFPRRLVGEPMLFGGVLVAISDRENPWLGDLKLSRFGPIAVEPRILDRGASSVLALARTSANGDPEASNTLFTLPIVGEGDQGDALIDLGPVAERVDFEPFGDGSHYQRLGSEVENLGWHDDTLVFDTHLRVESYLGDPIAIDVRWYLKAAATLEADFEPRANPPQRLFREAADGDAPPIARLATAAGPTHVFVNNVPSEYHAGFAAGFDAWNDLFETVLGAPVFTYEFVDGANLSPGDVRYNVLSWDVDNLAPYGGRTGFATDPQTGQTFASSVLIQGPTIVDDYTEWFSAAEAKRAATTPAAGRAAGARLVAVRARADLLDADTHVPPAQMSFAGVPFVREGRDPYAPQFDEPPAGETYESYMFGYFRSLVAHELGHVLGLRHNFAGSLAEDGVSIWSSSVMEYVWRGARHRSVVGPYDDAAIRFGYSGEPLPPDLVFCSHGELAGEAENNSPECSATDGGVDPFGFFRDEIVRRAFDHVIGRDAPGQVPVWTTATVARAFELGYQGMLYYATAAETQASWRKFHEVPSRPVVPADIRQYVVGELVAVACDASIAEHLEASHAMAAEAGIAGARAWQSLVDELAEAVATIDATVTMCSPAALVSFEY